MRFHLLLVVLAVAACTGDDSSDDAELDEFPYYLNFRVWQYETGEAELYACVYRYYWCEQVGTVQVQHGGQAMTLQRDSEGGDDFVGWSSATQEEEPFVFTWSPPPGRPPVTAEVTLAEELTISAPTSGSTLSATSPVILRWTEGSGDGLMAWGYNLQCPDRTASEFNRLVPDSGQVEIPATRLSLSPGCTSRLWLERLQGGETSSPRANVVASRARYVDVSIGP